MQTVWLVLIMEGNFAHAKNGKSQLGYIFMTSEGEGKSNSSISNPTYAGE